MAVIRVWEVAAEGLRGASRNPTRLTQPMALCCCRSNERLPFFAWGVFLLCPCSGVDVYTAVAGAVGALYGPLHGGANEAVLRMLGRIGSVDNIPSERLLFYSYCCRSTSSCRTVICSTTALVA